MKDTRKKELIDHVRTREAPSPTGLPHVGTALQVLFNWVFARRYEGKFIVRIEDTDKKRFVEGSEEGIMEAIEWLGLEPDESINNEGPYGPYRQSDRLDIYKKHAKKLIDQDHAYYCFCTEDRLTKMRQEQSKKHLPPKYDGKCKSLSKEKVKEKLNKKEPYVIRLNVPSNRTIIVNDMLRGEVKFDSNIVDDQVLIKSDGFPTYHLAVVVDDHLMKITHMKRGEEWLPSAPKHILLYEFFGWVPPKMIHMPTLRNADRSKLSKRKGNTSLWWYREQGYLKDALLNFLALLVWLPKDQREFFSKEEMIEEFEFKQIKLTGPYFDTKKLSWMNGNYIRKMESSKLLKEIENWANWVIKKGSDKKIIKGAKKLLKWFKKDEKIYQSAVELAQQRLKILGELPELISFYFTSELDYDLADLLQGQNSSKVKTALLAVIDELKKLKEYSNSSWEQTIRTTADKHDLSHKNLFMSLRSAVTAQKFTPPLYDVMNVLGLPESFKRIQRAANKLK